MKLPTKQIFTLAVTALAAVSSAGAVSLADIRFNDIDRDTTAINSILAEFTGRDNINPALIAERLVNTPYKGGTLEGSPEQLTINMEEFDCTTFAETVLALTMTLDEHRESWRDFAYNLERLRYRGGEVDGYASRLHYMSDWVIDNVHRGTVEDVSRLVGPESYEVKTLDYMSRHASSYPALADSTNLARLKDREIGYRLHRFPYIKRRDLQRTTLRDGDFVMLTTKTEGLDVSHVGFIKLVDGVPHLLHASSKEGRVVVDNLSLETYMKRNQSLSGIRVIRLKN
ncbi:MAG: DUF1460 domain-containing protein [Clostridium sp.]|nr:DUF1460 domain-containing protein [Clostridium sp.]